MSVTANQDQLQHKLFAAILARYNHPRVAVEALGEILNVSKSSVYKRLQGVKSISMDELSLLIEHYNIPAQVLLTNYSSRVSFDFPPLKEDQKITGGFLESVIQELELVRQATDGRIIYASTDLPFFYYFMFKEIAWFKLYLFQHSNSDRAISELPKISFSAIGDREIQLFERVKESYSEINSEEIWTARVFKITIDQIKYFFNVKLFQHPDEAILLLEKMESLAKALFEMVNKNNKGLMINRVKAGGTIDLSYNDFNRFNPVIIAESEHRSSLYLTYNLPNYLQTEDQRFIDYSKKWMQRIRRKAFSLSQNADIEQARFFNGILDHIHTESELLKQNALRGLWPGLNIAS